MMGIEEDGRGAVISATYVKPTTILRPDVDDFIMSSFPPLSPSWGGDRGGRVYSPPEQQSARPPKLIYCLSGVGLESSRRLSR